MPSLAWLGEQLPHLDQPHITTCGSIVLGCYGGTTSAGATTNEDAAWLLCATDARWQFAVLLDAHATSQSAAFIVQWCEQAYRDLDQICQQQPAQAITALSRLILHTFSSRAFRQGVRQVQGETACLIVFRTAQWLYWFSVGDCVVYLLHPDLMQLGQYALNQRQFYEWIGHVNTFEQEIPCFTSGVRELRNGQHTVVMLTDGVLECGERRFEDPVCLAQALMPRTGTTDLEDQVQALLEQVRVEQGRDSATVLAWYCTVINHQATQPSQ